MFHTGSDTKSRKRVSHWLLFLFFDMLHAYVCDPAGWRPNHVDVTDVLFTVVLGDAVDELKQFTGGFSVSRGALDAPLALTRVVF